MKKIEKEIMQRISSFLPNEHSFSLLEDSSSSWQQPKKKGLSKKGKIGLFAGLPSAALLAAEVATAVIFVGSAQKGKPFENGFIKDFSSMKAFGIACSPSYDLDDKKQAFQDFPFLEEPHYLLNEKGIESSDPIHFFAFGADGGYEEAILLKEDGNSVGNYTISRYEEGHDYIFVAIKQGFASSFHCDYYFSNESNDSFRIMDYYNGYYSDGDEYYYIISKRTGKIYDSRAPIVEDHICYREVPTINYFAYEDGITLTEDIDDAIAGEPTLSLYIGKEEDSKLVITEILDGDTTRTIKDYIFASGSWREPHEWIADRYGNVFIPGVGAYVNGHMVKDVAYDPYINTIYVFDQDTQEYHPVCENGAFDLNKRINDDSFVLYVSESQSVFSDGGRWGQWEPIYRGKDYLIVNGRIRDTRFANGRERWEGYYKLTFQEGEDGQRFYDKELLPVSLSYEVIGQGDNLFFIERDEKDVAHLYCLNCSTLEVESFSFGVEDNAWVISDWAVEPNGDVWVTGLTSDLSTFEGYIVDGEFTYERTQRQTKDDHKVYYVRPLN